jgi:hypothetical protein
VITVTVVPVNDPPLLEPLPKITGTVEKLQKFDLSDYLLDVDNNINELKISVTSTKFDIVVSGRELVIYSDKSAIDNITITVSDGLNETTGNMLIEIRGDKSKPTDSNDFLTSILWILIVLIIIIFTISAYTTWRKYNGNYEIDEIYWIHNGGVLINHQSFIDLKHRADSDIMSGMLLGILNFTQEAFAENETETKIWSVKEIQMKGKNLLIERGKYTFLATVFTGRSGKSLYKKSQSLLFNVESKYGSNLYDWDGKESSVAGSKKILRSILS